MAFMGITLLGPQNYFHCVLKDGYKEPVHTDNVPKLMNKIERESSGCTQTRPQSNVVVDVYVGRVDGFAYGSNIKFDKMKRKGVLKPVGPTEIYKKPATEQCNYGWSVCDPALKNATWTETHPRWPKPISPNTKVLDAERKNNKYATLF